MMANDHKIPCSHISSKDLQINIIMERVHQTVGNIIHALRIQDINLDNVSP